MDDFLTKCVPNKAQLNADIASFVAKYSDWLGDSDLMTERLKEVCMMASYTNICAKHPQDFIYNSQKWPLVLGCKKPAPFELKPHKHKEYSRYIKIVFEGFIPDCETPEQQIFANNWSWLSIDHVDLIITACRALTYGCYKEMVNQGVWPKLFHITNRPQAFRDKFLKALTSDFESADPSLFAASAKNSKPTQTALSDAQQLAVQQKITEMTSAATAHMSTQFEPTWANKHKLKKIIDAIYFELTYNQPTYNSSDFDGVCLRRDAWNLLFYHSGLPANTNHFKLSEASVELVLHSNSKTNTDGHLGSKSFSIDPDSKLGQLLRAYQPMASKLNHAVFPKLSQKKSFGQPRTTPADKSAFHTGMQNILKALGLPAGQRGVGAARKTNARRTVAAEQADIASAGGTTSAIQDKKRKAAASSLHSTATAEKYARVADSQEELTGVSDSALMDIPLPAPGT